MRFLKENYKLIIAGLVFQLFIISVILIKGNKGDIREEKEIENFSENNFTYEDLDLIEDTKKESYQGFSSRNSDDEYSKASEIGKSKVDLELTVKAKNESEKTTAKKNPSKVKPIKKAVKQNKNVDKSEDEGNKETNKINSVEGVKKIVVGTWKSVNDSNGKNSDMYIEFFEDGSYQKYDRDRDIVFTGKYTFSSVNRIKMTYETIENNISGSVRKENEVFTADIDFIDESNFSVTDMKHFNFLNYKKVK